MTQQNQIFQQIETTTHFHHQHQQMPCTSICAFLARGTRGGGSGNTVEAHTVNACSSNNVSKTSGGSTKITTNEIVGYGDGLRPHIGYVDHGSGDREKRKEEFAFYPLRFPSTFYHSSHTCRRNGLHTTAVGTPHFYISNSQQLAVNDYNHHHHHHQYHYHINGNNNEATLHPLGLHVLKSNKEKNGVGTVESRAESKGGSNIANPKMQQKNNKMAELTVDSIFPSKITHTITNRKNNKPSEYYEDRSSAIHLPPHPPLAVATAEHSLIFCPSAVGGYLSSHKSQISDSPVVVSVVCSGDTEMGRHVLADRFRTQLCRNYLKKKAEEIEKEKEEEKKNNNKLEVGGTSESSTCLRIVSATTNCENTNKREHVPVTAASALALLESYCPYESRCLFAHGEAQLRTAAQNIADGLISEEAIKVFKQREREERWRRLVAESEEWGTLPLTEREPSAAYRKLLSIEGEEEEKVGGNEPRRPSSLGSCVASSAAAFLAPVVVFGVERVSPPQLFAPPPPSFLPAVATVLPPSVLSTPQRNIVATADLALLHAEPVDDPMMSCHTRERMPCYSKSPFLRQRWHPQKEEGEEGEEIMAQIMPLLSSFELQIETGRAAEKRTPNTSDTYRHHNLHRNGNGNKDREDRALSSNYHFSDSPLSPQGLSFFIERDVMLPESLIAPASSHTSQNALPFPSIPRIHQNDALPLPSYLPQQVPTLTLVVPPTPPRGKEGAPSCEGGAMNRGCPLRQSHDECHLLSSEMRSENERGRDAGSRVKTVSTEGMAARRGSFLFSLPPSLSSSIGETDCCVVCSCEYQPVSSRWTCSRHARKGSTSCGEDAYSPSQHSPLSAVSSRPSPAHPYTHNPYAPPIPLTIKK